MVKICFYSSFFPPIHYGGIEIFTMELADTLSKLNQEIFIITTNNQFHSVIDATTYDYTVYFLPKLIKIPIFGSLLNLLFSLKTIHDIKPDVLHIMSISNGWLGVVIKKFYGIPFIIHGAGDDVYANYRFKKLIISKSCNEASLCIAISNEMAALLKNEGVKNVIIIPNAINTFKFDRGLKNKLRGARGVSENSVVITFAGRIIKAKGLIHLLRSFKCIVKNQLELRIIGDGIFLEELKLICNEMNLDKYVKFLGRLPNNLVVEELIMSDIFVLPSLSEGSPISILEAMAAGLPVVATNVGGIPDQIEDGVHGFLIKPGDEQMLANKLSILINDEEFRKNVSNNVLCHIKSYDIEHIAAVLLNKYQMVNKLDLNM